MSEKTNAVKPKFLPAINKQTKLSVQIQQKSFDLIYEYQNFLKEVSNADVSPGSLVSAFINSAVTSDKSFIIWKKNKSEQAEKDEAKTDEKVKTPPKEKDKSEAADSSKGSPLFK